MFALAAGFLYNRGIEPRLCFNLRFFGANTADDKTLKGLSFGRAET